MKTGKVMGGGPFEKNTLMSLLKNALYVGKIRYQGELHDGQHEAIVDRKVWDAVEHQLKHHTKQGGSRVRSRFGSLLRGLVRCGVCGSAMTVHSARGRNRNRRYGAYVCLKYLKQGAALCPGSRVPVGELEKFVVDRLKAIAKDPRLVRETVKGATNGLQAKKGELEKELERLEEEREKDSSAKKASSSEWWGRAAKDPECHVSEKSNSIYNSSQADVRLSRLDWRPWRRRSSTRATCGRRWRVSSLCGMSSSPWRRPGYSTS